MTDARNSPLGTVLDRRYRLDAEIGEGAMGVVYQATHVLIDKPVAVKVLRHVAPRLLGRFLKEARLASRIDHPNVVDLSDCGELPDGGAYFVMELLDGEPLSQTIARERRIDPARTLRLAKQIVEGLRAAHAVGVVHRDMKPENVFLCRGDRPHHETVKLLDFGVARADGSKDTLPGSIFGTPEYMAPEQARGDVADPRADLYALGVMLFEMLVGRVPIYAGDIADLMRKKLHDPAPRVSEAAPGLSVAPEVDSLVANLLALDPDARPPNAEAVAAALDRVVAEPVRAAAPDGARTAGKPTIEMGSGSTDALAQMIAPPNGGAAKPERVAGWRPPKQPPGPGPAPDKPGGARPVLPPGITLDGQRAGRSESPPQPVRGGTVRPGAADSVAAIRSHQHHAPVRRAEPRPVPSPSARRAPAPRPVPATPPARSRSTTALSIVVAMVAAAVSAAVVTFGVARVVPRGGATPEASAPAAPPQAAHAAAGDPASDAPGDPVQVVQPSGAAPPPTAIGHRPAGADGSDAPVDPKLDSTADPTADPLDVPRGGDPEPEPVRDRASDQDADPGMDRDAALARSHSLTDPTSDRTARARKRKPISKPTAEAPPPVPPDSTQVTEGPAPPAHASQAPQGQPAEQPPGASRPATAHPPPPEPTYDLKDPFSGN